MRSVYIFISTGAAIKVEGEDEKELREKMYEAAKQLRESIDY